MKADERYKTKIDTLEETWDIFKRVVIISVWILLSGILKGHLDDMIY